MTQLAIVGGADKRRFVAAVDEWLVDGGAMGARIRAHDWASTTLGPREQWPSNLRASLRLLLSAPYPMSLMWGPELLHFCNDRLAQLLGLAKQPRLIGSSAYEGIGPIPATRVEQVLRHGTPDVVEDHLVCVYRDNQAEELHLTFQLDPVLDHTGATCGVSLVVNETSDRVVSARRTAVLRELAADGMSVQSVDEACRCALAALSRHSVDIPFALLYRRGDGTEAVLAGTAGLPIGSAASPQRIPGDATNVTEGWPVVRALTERVTITVDDLSSRFGPLPSGGWPFVPRAALVVPLTGPRSDTPDAVLIVGVSARRALDTEYRNFIELVARQVAASILAGRAYEEERRHVEATAAAAKLALLKRRARERALEARFEGIIEERSRMAREIHDTLLQGVTGIALQLRATLPSLRSKPRQAAETLESIAALAEQTSREARKAVWDMRVGAPDGAELAEALGDAARRAAGASGVVVEAMRSGKVCALSRTVRDTIFHVGQEALVNALKHANARRVTVSIAYEPHAARLTVRDDGRGFRVDPDFRSYAGHWGLLGMGEQSNRIGARLSVSSTPGRGTTVELCVPLSARKRALRGQPAKG
jgi:signal transduction histidine kinase